MPLLVTLGLRLGAAAYYVDNAAGNDSYAGTSTTAAWKHCPGDSVATGVAATVALLPGDTVFFKGGVTYVFTGATGITLRWNGQQDSPITYDGNSAGTWGVGRAKFSDNYGLNSITAFAATTASSWLKFKNLEISCIGGAPFLPADPGTAAAPRSGGGFAFAAGATRTTIENCVFTQLGYWFNQKPMAAASLVGTAIAMRGADTVSVLNCDFSKMTVGIDLSGSTVLNANTITNCAFHDSVVWPLSLPANSASGVAISGCTVANNTQYDRASWSGYGENPRMSAKTVSAGATVTLTATAIALPAASLQWQKDGQAIVGAQSADLTLSSVSSANAGIYTVIASNSVGSAVSHEVVLTVTGSSTSTIPPTITSQPVSQTVPPLTNVTFAVAATGAPTPGYQWFRNGGKLSGATGATLTLPNVSSADAATYYAIATNAGGSVTSEPAALAIATTTGTGTAPVITTQPVSQTAAPLSTVTFTVAASGSPAPTIQWFRNGTTFAGWTGASLKLESVSSNDVGTYIAVATNTAGSVSSDPAALTVDAAAPIVTSPTPTGTAPTITTQPLSQTVTALSSVTLTVGASGSPTPTLQWFKNGVAITGATSATLTFASVGSTDGAKYFAVATNSLGSAQSSSAVLTVNPPPILVTGIAPVFTLQPISATASAKATVTFTAAASGTPAPTYQWKKDGATINGATASSLEIANINKGDTGTYTVVATNAAGSITSNGAVLALSAAKGAGGANGNDPASGNTTSTTTSQTTIETAPSSRLVNLSVRANAGAGDESLLVGFVVAGDSSKSLLIRGSGPALSNFGVTNVLTDPTLELYSGTKLLAANDDWSSSIDAARIAPAAQRVGAFALSEASRDAALLADVASGAYTSQVSGKQNSPGAALIELYDADASADTRLVNVSVRTIVKPNGEAPSIGFVIAGTEPKKLLIRAVGPTLAAFGVTGALSDPQLDVYKGNDRVQRNDDWGGSTELSDAFGQVGAFSLASAASKDAALIFTAQPGAYTAVISSANNAGGTVLVEVYEMQ